MNTRQWLKLALIGAVVGAGALVLGTQPFFG